MVDREVLAERMYDALFKFMVDMDEKLCRTTVRDEGMPPTWKEIRQLADAYVGEICREDSHSQEFAARITCDMIYALVDAATESQV